MRYLLIILALAPSARAYNQLRPQDTAGLILHVASFTASGTWTPPPGVTTVTVTVVVGGGGGGGASGGNTYSGGGGGSVGIVVDSPQYARRRVGQ